MSAHGPTREHNNDTGNQIALGSSTSVPRKPHPHEPGAPPDDSHAGVLKIVVHPWTAPSMLGKGVNNAPCSNDSTIEEFLTAASALNPELTDQKKKGEEDSISNECGAHDEMRQTLSGVISSAESKSDNSSKEHLNPGSKRHSLS